MRATIGLLVLGMLAVAGIGCGSDVRVSETEATKKLRSMGWTIYPKKDGEVSVWQRVIAYDQKAGDIEGIKYLASLSNVTVLGLYGDTVRDKHLEYLHAMGPLEFLALTSSRVTDAGLKHLNGLTIRELRLDNCTHITDAGLVQLRYIKQLHQVWLDGTPVTEAGIAELLQAMPDLVIHRDAE